MVSHEVLIGVGDLAGVFVFALSGALLAIRHRLDIFGVLVLAIATSLAGGLMRDVALGIVPPVALQEQSYLLCALAAGLLTFFGHPIVSRLRRPVALLDAFGLGIFTVAGCFKAIALDTTVLTSLLIAVLTAVGGGVVRDVLVSEVPLILRDEIYAIASLAGALVIVIGAAWHWPDLVLATAGFAVTVALRLAGLRWGWRAPRAPWS